MIAHRRPGSRGLGRAARAAGLPPHATKKENEPYTMGHDSKKTKTRTIRIRNEVYEYFKDKPLNKVVEGVYDYMKGGEIVLTESGVELKVYRGIYNMRTFERLCRELNCRPDLMMDKVVASMERNLEKRKAEKEGEKG